MKKFLKIFLEKISYNYYKFLLKSNEDRQKIKPVRLPMSSSNLTSACLLRLLSGIIKPFKVCSTIAISCSDIFSKDINFN